MRSKNMLWGQVMLGLAALLPASNGCGPRFTARAEQPSAEARIQKIASLCSRYGAKHRRKPGSIEELKAWTKSLDKPELARMGIEDADAAFVSPRDNQPFVLVKSPGSGPGDVLAYEKVGEGGKHYIVTPMGSAFELDEAELKRRVPSAK